MSDEKKLVVVMLDVLAEIHEMRKGMDGMRSEMNSNLTELNQRVGKLEKEQSRTSKELVKVNLQLGENTRAILKLADKVEVVPNLVERVVKLEAEVFRKAS
jgi:Sec-independent protein translocase protein TatA